MLCLPFIHMTCTSIFLSFRENTSLSLTWNPIHISFMRNAHNMRRKLFFFSWKHFAYPLEALLLSKDISFRIGHATTLISFSCLISCGLLGPIKTLFPFETHKMAKCQLLFFAYLENTSGIRSLQVLIWWDLFSTP